MEYQHYVVQYSSAYQKTLLWHKHIFKQEQANKPQTIFSVMVAFMEGTKTGRSQAFAENRSMDDAKVYRDLLRDGCKQASFMMIGQKSNNHSNKALYAGTLFLTSKKCRLSQLYPW